MRHSGHNYSFCPVTTVITHAATAHAPGNAVTMSETTYPALNRRRLGVPRKRILSRIGPEVYAKLAKPA